MSESLPSFNPRQMGATMHHLITDLYPICRSITGNGIRESLEVIRQQIPLEIHEVPTGTQVFDWTVPKEWNVRDAYVKNARGDKVIDFRKSNLHIVNYSIPIHNIVSLSELKEHLYSIPDHPDWIPYRTSYYKEYWGFCLSFNDLQRLEDGEYEVCIDTSLEDGHLTYGEYYIEGETQDEVLISCHCCHPSLCNDNLSGMALTTFLAKTLQSVPKRYSYRFLFIPGTIGSIAWLALNESQARRIKHGLVVACVGDAGRSNYKKSRQGDAVIDRAAEHVLKHSGQPYGIIDFYPYGYDERQYCSPGFNLPVGSLTRTPHSQFPEYHTSADNLEFIQPDCLVDSLNKYLDVINVLENNRFFINTHPMGEPQLGKRGVYDTFGGKKDNNMNEMAMLWVLNMSDGHHSLLDIAERSGLEFGLIKNASDLLIAHELLKDSQGAPLLINS